MYIKTTAMMDSDDYGKGQRFACYTDGKRWNGWMMPLFPREELGAVLFAVTSMNDDPAEFAVRFDAARDVVVITEQGESYEVAPQVIRDVETDEEVKVCGVGAGSWCWVELTAGDILLNEMRAMYPDKAWELAADISDALGFEHEGNFVMRPNHSNPPWVEVDSVAEYGIAKADADRIEAYNEGRE